LSGDGNAEKEYLQKYFKSEYLHFKQSPTDKLKYIKNLEKNHKTIMLGDGLNDAGALAVSSCGITISENNGNFSPACDAILDAASLKKLPEFLAYSKACVNAVKYSLGVSLLYNIIGLFFAMQGILKPLVAAIIMPLSSISVVLFVTIATNLLSRKYRINH
jgi:Cu+-exporting ATPase